MIYIFNVILNYQLIHRQLGNQQKQVNNLILVHYGYILNYIFKE